MALKGRSKESRRRELRNFGITLAVAFGLLGLVALWRGRFFYPYLFGASAAFALLGLVAPLALAPVNKAWMTAASVLGWVMTRVVLTLLFYLVFTPIGLIGRLSGRKFLEARIDRSRSTYWIRREHAEHKTADYERQF